MGICWDKKNKEWYFQEYGLDGKRHTVRGGWKIDQKTECIQAWHEYCYMNKRIQKYKVKTFDDVVLHFLEHVKVKYEKGTYTNYKGFYNNHLGAFKGILLKDLNKSFIREWYDRKSEDGTASMHVMNGLVKLLKASFNYAKEEDLIIINPFEVLHSKKIAKKNRNRFSIKRLFELIEFTKENMPNFYLQFVLATLSGMRVGEYIALRKEDVANTKIDVSKQYYRGEIKKTKTLSSLRTVVIANVVIEAIRWHCAKYNIFSGYLFPSPIKEGYPLSSKTPDRRFKKMLELNGYDTDYMRLHDLRGEYIDIQHSQGVKDIIISRQVGHSTTKVMLDTYSYILDEDKEAARVAIDNAFEEVQKKRA